MTLTLSKELVGKGIRVNSILLGMVESGQWQRRFENRADKARAGRSGRRISPVSAASRWRVSASRRSRAGAAVPRLAAGLVYHRRGAGRFRRLLPPPVKMMKKVMLIGYGAMAQAVIERLPPRGYRLDRGARISSCGDSRQFGDAVRR
jgi:hypothetical protein